MGPYQRTPKEVARAIRYSGLEVCSVGPVGDFVDINKNYVPKNHWTPQKKRYLDVFFAGVWDLQSPPVLRSHES